MTPLYTDRADVKRDVCAIVLGGGRGTRLFPLTAERAKPAVPLGGRYRLIDIPLSNCIHSDVNRVYVMTQFNSASLNRHINNTYKFDHFGGGFVEILAAQQTDEAGEDWYQGTADAVRKHLNSILNCGAKHFLILSGDQLYRMDYRTMLATHIKSNADITVGALPVDPESARSFGIMKVQKNGRIKEFVEKPQTEEALSDLVSPADMLARHGLTNLEGRPHLASMGVYVFRAEVLQEILSKRIDWIDFGQHVLPKSLVKRKVYAHPFDGFWEDIGTVRSFYETSLALCVHNPPFKFYDANHPIFTRPRYLPGSRLLGAALKDSILCEGCHLTGTTVSNSIIGVRSIAQAGSHIERSIIMGADFYEAKEDMALAVPVGIGRNTRISGAIVDKNARIGKNVVIKGSKRLKDRDGDGWAIRDGVVVVTKNALIPDGTHIG
jgi:glucose-1-phosphate adenylyltransferase